MSSKFEHKPVQYEAFDDLEDEERIYLDESGINSLKQTHSAMDDPIIKRE